MSKFRIDGTALCKADGTRIASVAGSYLRRNQGGEFEKVAILVAITVKEAGYRKVWGAAESLNKDRAN